MSECLNPIARRHFVFVQFRETLKRNAKVKDKSVDEIAAQGDQIGRIFASWVIVFLRQFFENYKSSPDFWATFFPRGSLCIEFHKKSV
jgi:hypothetical protein